jgi:hypothetical protein
MNVCGCNESSDRSDPPALLNFGIRYLCVKIVHNQYLAFLNARNLYYGKIISYCDISFSTQTPKTGLIFSNMTSCCVVT